MAKVYFKKGCFYGIYGINFVDDGAWSDPELVWHGKSFNYYDVENPLWEDYKEECTEENREPNTDEFAVWVKKNAYMAREYLQNLMDAKCFYGE
jgi:hypothetical protein